MRLGDLIHLPLAALWQQKVRTFLTTLGVVFGSFVLAASLSVGQGVQNTIEKVSHRSDLLRKISVNPSWRMAESKQPDVEVQVPGEMTDEQRDRIRTALKLKAKQEVGDQTRVKLNLDMLEKLKSLEHVEEVVPIVWMHGPVQLDQQKQKDSKQTASMSSAQLDNPDCKKRLVAGRLFESLDENSVIVNEFLLYRLGLIDATAQQAAVGRTLRIEFQIHRQEARFYLSLINSDGRIKPEEQVVLERLQGQLPQVISSLKLDPADQLILKNAMTGTTLTTPDTIHADFTIVGVMRLPTPEEEKANWDPSRIYTEMVLPTQSAVDLFFRVPDYANDGINQATVIADSEFNCKLIAEQLKGLGLQVHAPIEYIERERLMYLMIFGAMTCVAAVAMFVAALGIANTMLMSVLERTREIGIMKAVGAGNGTLTFLFLTEGGLIGLLGGSVGLLLAWVASFPGDAWVRSMVSREMKIELEESIFVFPIWLSVVVLSFAVLVTTLAAVMPARRAARIDPVKALRHE